MALTATQVQQAYLAYFGRPADVLGLNYWEGQTLATMTAGFTGSPEFAGLYAGLSPAAQVQQVYQNVLGRSAGSAAITYWGGQLMDGVSISALVNTIYNTVLNESPTSTDYITVQNRVSYATQFTTMMSTSTPDIIGYNGSAAANAARSALFTAVPSSAVATTTFSSLAANVNSVVNVGSAASATTFTLTTGIDSPGTGAFAAGSPTGNSTINGVFGTANGGATDTLNALDSIKATGTGNILNLFDQGNGTNAIPSGVTISGVQTVNINAANGETVNSSGWTGLTNLNLTTAINTANDQITAASTTNVTVTDTATSSVNNRLSVIGGNNVTVTESATAGFFAGVYVDGASGVTTVNQAGVGPVDIGGSSAAVTGAVVVNATAGSYIDVNGGTTVTVTDSEISTVASLTAGSVNIGGGGGVAAGVATQTPTGAVNVTENLTGDTVVGVTAPATNTIIGTPNTTTGGAINITGGTTVTVNENATQPLNTAPAAGATSTNNLAQEGAVTITGSALTTAVTVNQTASVAEVNTTTAKAAVAEVDTVTFAAQTVAGSVSFGGLTFTTTQALTAAQVAAAFANLTAGATQGNSTLGTYSGAFTGTATSGAVTTTATASTVNFTAETAGTVTGLTAGTGTTLVSTTPNVVGVTAVVGVGGIAAGKVTIADANSASATAANTITTATVNGYATNSSVSSNALTNLSLSNSGPGTNTVFSANNVTATTLNLTLNNVNGGVALNDGTHVGNAAYTALNITTAGTNSAANIAANNVTALTVTGTNALDLTTTNAGNLGNADVALKTITVSGSAGLTGVFTGAAFTDLNASATSGNVTATINAGAATYEGGSGSDIVTTSANVTKAISLGAGNDTFVLGTFTVAGTAGLINGGTGTNTLSIDAGSAATDSASTTFATDVTNFQDLTLTGGATAATIDLNKLGGYAYVTDNAAVALTLENIGSAGTLVFNSVTSATASNTVTLQSTAAVTTAASLNIDALSTYVAPVTTNASGTLSTTTGSDNGTTATVTLAATPATTPSFYNSDITSVNVVSTDNGLSAGYTGTPANNSVTLTDSGNTVTTITVSGNGAINLTATGTALTTVNASANTGGLTYTTTGSVAETVTGSATAANTLTAHAGTTADTLIGGTANDTLTANAGMDTLTGGSGNDTFVITTASTNVNSYATITDAHVGDTIALIANHNHNAVPVYNDTFTQSAVTLGSTAVFQDYANAVIHSTSVGAIDWFQYSGNTYIVENQSGGTSFVNGTDVIVKLTGTVDLSHTSLNVGSATTHATLLIG